MFDRVNHPAKGRDGGQWRSRRCQAGRRHAAEPKGWQHVPAGRRLILNCRAAAVTATQADAAQMSAQKTS